MTTNYYARTEYDGDGSEDDFDFTWPYISASHVHVYVDDVEATIGWSLSTSSRVTFVVAPASGTVVRIQRETSRDARLVDYVGGSALTEASLDTDSLQAHYLAQEAIDVSTAGIIEALAAVTGTGAVPGISTPADNNKVLLVDAGVAKWQKISTSNMSFTPPSLTADNTFLGENYFSDIVTVAATLTVTLNDAGATAGPDILTYRTSASPAADDFIGGYQFGGANSAAEAIVYGEVRGQIKDAMDGTEDGQIALTVSQAGSLVDEARVGLGMSVGASNTPQGVGTINVDSYMKQDDAYPLYMDEVTLTGTTDSPNSAAIPSWAKRVIIQLNDITFDGSAQLTIELKDTDWVTSGYSHYIAHVGTSPGSSLDAAGGASAITESSFNSSTRRWGRLVFERVGSTNEWILNGSGAIYTGNPYSINYWGSVALTSALTDIRISTVAGTASFSTGTAAVIVE